jgi:hypothetical protein
MRQQLRDKGVGGQYRKEIIKRALRYVCAARTPVIRRSAKIHVACVTRPSPASVESRKINSAPFYPMPCRNAIRFGVFLYKK